MKTVQDGETHILCVYILLTDVVDDHRTEEL